MVRRIVAVGLLITTGACSTIQPVAGSPEAFVSTKNPDFVLITTRTMDSSDGPTYLSAPRVEGGAIAGFIEGTSDRTSVPLVQIQRIEAKQFNGKRTAFAAVLGAAAIGMTAYVWGQAGDGRAGPEFCPINTFPCNQADEGNVK